MLFYLENWEGVSPAPAQSKHMLTKLYWQKGDYPSAQQKIDELDSIAEYNGLAAILQKLHNMQANHDSLPVLLPDTVLFDSLANDTTHYGFGLARNLMTFLTGKFYPRYVEMPSASRGSGSSIRFTELEEKSSQTQAIKVYPNPNNGQFYVNWNFDEASDFNYQLVDIQGRIVQKGTLIGKEGEKLLSIKLGSVGLYQLVVFDNGIVVHQEQIVVHD